MKNELVRNPCVTLLLINECLVLTSTTTRMAKKIYKPTNNNLRTSSNTSRANQDNSPRINRGTGYDNQRAVNVAGARENVDDESEEQELEATLMNSWGATDSRVNSNSVDNSVLIFDDDPMHKEYTNADHMNAILGIYTDLDEFTDLQCDYGETLEKCERLEKELSKSRTMSKSFESLQKHAINLELDLQHCKEKIKHDQSFKENHVLEHIFVFHFSCKTQHLPNPNLLKAKATSLKHGYGIGLNTKRPARTPEQNGVVERRNRTLIEAARTMLSAAKVPLFFWAEAIANSMFYSKHLTCNLDHEKNTLHIINARKPSVKFFHIFGSLCYIVRDGENLDKMKEKGDACIFVGPQMASDHVSSDPGPQCSTMVLEQDSLSPGPQSQENVPQVAETVTTSNELELPR
ncbi:retrovirus-related pol polyprotein from transposon TNT 1-94 [Tanacetum coccineum]